MTEPLGNNGQHTLALTAPVAFLGPTQQVITNVGPEAKAVTTENVYITDVQCSNGTVDYFKWDPEGEDTSTGPILTFTIADADPQRYRWRVRFRPAGESDDDYPPGWREDDPAVQGTVSATDGPLTVTVSLADPQLQGGLNIDDHGRGPYAYDVSVHKYALTDEQCEGAPLDSYALKAPYKLCIPLSSCSDDLQPGHFARCLSTEDGDELRVGYWFMDESSQPPAAAEITALDAQLRERGDPLTLTAPLRSLSEMHGGDDLDEDGQADGILLLKDAQEENSYDGWRAIWTAADGSGAASPQRRTHDPARMLATNVPPVEPVKYGLVVTGMGASTAHFNVGSMAAVLEGQFKYQVPAHSGNVLLRMTQGRRLAGTNAEPTGRPAGTSSEPTTGNRTTVLHGDELMAKWFGKRIGPNNNLQDNDYIPHPDSPSMSARMSKVVWIHSHGNSGNIDLCGPYRIDENGHMVWDPPHTHYIAGSKPGTVGTWFTIADGNYDLPAECTLALFQACWTGISGGVAPAAKAKDGMAYVIGFKGRIKGDEEGFSWAHAILDQCAQVEEREVLGVKFTVQYSIYEAVQQRTPSWCIAHVSPVDGNFADRHFGYDLPNIYVSGAHSVKLDRK